ncbi:MAG: hypothetical protein IJG43_07715 [Acidaminococcaceae bacterium]|jgi:hypothetical protein|nr:hypothetical protein [Acidaminococcaceae bacterium]
MMKAHKMFSNRPLVIWTDMREKEYWVFPTQKKAEAFFRSVVNDELKRRGKTTDETGRNIEQCLSDGEADFDETGIELTTCNVMP